MRLGIFGGTFDPVHYGHLLLAEQCREQCDLDEVWLIPAGIPPHKAENSVSAGKDRTEMLNLAIAGHEHLRVSERELERPGASYTYQTLEQLSAEDPARELFLIIGADSLRDLPMWREPQRILELANLAVVNRGDQPAPSLDDLRTALGESAVKRTSVVTIPGVGFSSSDIRERVAAGKSIRYMTPRAVECYIQAHGLYTGD